MSSYRDRQRLSDIQAAIDAIRSHLQRGALTDGLVFGAVRIRLLEIGEAVKALPAELLDTQPTIPWSQIAGCVITWPTAISIQPTRSCRPPSIRRPARTRTRRPSYGRRPE